MLGKENHYLSNYKYYSSKCYSSNVPFSNTILPNVPLPNTTLPNVPITILPNVPFPQILFQMYHSKYYSSKCTHYYSSKCTLSTNTFQMYHSILLFQMYPFHKYYSITIPNTTLPNVPITILPNVPFPQILFQMYHSKYYSSKCKYCSFKYYFSKCTSFKKLIYSILLCIECNSYILTPRNETSVYCRSLLK